MKFSLLASSILLGTTAPTVTALQGTCCYADPNVGCPSGFEAGQIAGMINGIENAVQCCLPNEEKYTVNVELCEGTVAPNTGTGGAITTTTTTTSGSDPFGEEFMSGGDPTSSSSSSSSGTDLFSGGSMFGGGDITGCGELRTQFPDCSCIIQCPDEDAKCYDDTGCVAACDKPHVKCTSSSSSSVSTSTSTTTTTGNAPSGAPSGAMVISSASAIFVGASVVTIFFLV